PASPAAAPTAAYVPAIATTYDDDKTKARRGLAWLPTTIVETMGIIGNVHGVNANNRPNPKNSSVPVTGPSVASRRAAAWSSPSPLSQGVLAASTSRCTVCSDCDPSDGCSAVCSPATAGGAPALICIVCGG